MSLQRTIVFISGSWPGTSSGYAIANASTLSYFHRLGYRCIYAGPAEEPLASEEIKTYEGVEFHAIDLSRKLKVFRFFRSLFSSSPAITERFWKAASRLPEQIRQWGVQSSDPLFFFYEDIPAGWLMKTLKPAFPSAKHILRSHNVVVKGFEGLTRTGTFLNRWAWKMELKKIRIFEKELFSIADRSYAISEEDAAWYRERLQINPDGVISFFIEPQIDSPVNGSDENILYLGSADLRKGTALARFIAEAWPRIHAARPDVQLILGGIGTERFHRPEMKVIGLGFVESEEQVMKMGSIFINPQQIGAGVKIKSLIALIHAKLLVSTSIGVEGTGLIHKNHCIIEDRFDRQADWILQLLNRKNERDQISARGKAYVEKQFSKEHFFRSMDSLFYGEP